MQITTLPVGMLGTNCYIISDEENRCAVIDPGAAPQKILGAIEEKNLHVQAILLTHAHFDHTGALKTLHAQYPDVPIYIHRLDSDNDHNMSHGNLIYTHTYEEGDEIAAGNMRFAVLHTPGHTPGSVCLLSQNTLFAGDTLFQGACGRTDFEGGSMMDMLRSLRRLSELSGDVRVYPGHGDATTIAAERQFNPYLQEAMR